MYLLICGILTLTLYFFVFRKSRRDKLYDAIPGPRRPPYIGCMFDFILTPVSGHMSMLRKWCEKYGPALKTQSGPIKFVTFHEPKYTEKLLTSNVHTHKGFIYDLMRPWLGDGLVISSGEKWFHRRKLLTPAFHFKILEDFMPIFNEQSFKLIKILKNKHGEGSTFDFVSYITHCTLDVICETAMGKPMNAQDGQNLEYIHAVREFAEVLQDRSFRPWLNIDFFWKRSALYKKQEELLKILHGFTDSVIRERKKMRSESAIKKAEAQNTEDKANNDKDSIYFGQVKKRKAFLDLLLDVQEEIGDKELTDQNIREETDTFMFAGHDTTSTSIGFAVYSLGAYPEIQAKVREELETIFGDDKTRPVTPEDLTKMKYLDCVIKESLRLYPSVPFIQRDIKTDWKIDENLEIPAGITLGLFIYQLHRNPEYFPEPEVFKPERFSEGESRNPFAYVPFSAGPRNCIGQRFALMEEKVIVANIVRNFVIKSVKRPEDMVVAGQLTLQSLDGIQIQLTCV